MQYGAARDKLLQDGVQTASYALEARDCVWQAWTKNFPCMDRMGWCVAGMDRVGWCVAGMDRVA